MIDALALGQTDPLAGAQRLSALPPGPIVRTAQGRLWTAALARASSATAVRRYVDVRAHLDDDVRADCDARLEALLVHEASILAMDAVLARSTPAEARRALAALPPLPGRPSSVEKRRRFEQQASEWHRELSTAWVKAGPKGPELLGVLVEALRASPRASVGPALAGALTAVQADLVRRSSLERAIAFDLACGRALGFRPPSDPLVLLPERPDSERVEAFLLAARRSVVDA